MGKKPRLIALDGLKVLFCFLILLHHYWGGVTDYGEYGAAPLQNVLLQVYTHGYLGVEFFFICSGFMMTYNHKGKWKKIPIWNSLIQRMYKLIPLASLSVIVGFVLSAISSILNYGIPSIDKPINFFNLVLSLLFINNGWLFNSFNSYGSGIWFIDVLMLCYLCWILVNKFSNNDRQYTLACSLFVLIGFLCNHLNLNVPFLFPVSGRGYFNFFLGCLLCLAYEKRWYTFFPACVLIGLPLGLVLKDVGLLFSLCVCTILFCVALYAQPVKRLLSTKILNVFVPFTMSVYMTHVLIISSILILDKYFQLGISFDRLFIMLFIFSISILFSILLHYFFEMPVNSAIKKRLLMTKECVR